MVDPDYTDIEAISREFPEHSLQVQWFGLKGTVHLSAAERAVDGFRAGKIQRRQVATAEVSREGVGGKLAQCALERCISNLRTAISST